MKYASKVLIAVTFAAAMVPAKVAGAIAVDGMTAEKLGIPPEDFVTPEEAKEVALQYFNKFAGVKEPAAKDQVIILPWVIEDWNKYEPEVFMGYYEIMVYNGLRHLESYEELKKVISDHVSAFAHEVIMDRNELRYPDELLERKRLTVKLLGNADIGTYWVRVNRARPAVIEPAYDTAIGSGFVTPEIGRQVLERLFGVERAEYERTVVFGIMNIFDIFRVDGKEVYLQFGDKANKTRFFTDTEGFDGYLEAERSVIDTERLRKREPWDPFKWKEEDSFNDSEEMDELPEADSHLQPYVPEMDQGIYYVRGEPIFFACGLAAMANLIAFWCGGGYFENPPGVPPEPGIELQFSPELYPCSWPYRNFYKDDNFAASMAARVCIMHGIMPSHVYVRRIAGSLNEGFPSFIRRDIKYYHHFPPLTDPDAVDYHRAQDYHDYYEEEHWPTFPTPAGYWNPCDSDNWDYIKSTIALPQVIVVGETEYKFRGWPIWLSTLWGWASQGKWSFAHAYTIYGYYDTGHTVKCKTSWKLKPEQDLSFDNPWHPYKDADVMAGEFVFVKNSSYSIDAAVEYCVVYEENNKKIFDWSLASNAKTWAKKMNVVAVTGQGYKVVVNEKPVKVNFNETAYSLEYNVSSLPKGARYNLEVVLRNGDKLEYPFKEGKQ